MIVEKVSFKSFGIVSKDDLPFHCPPKDSSKWNMHPKVFLSFDEEGKANCPYCGMDYRLEQ
jgi:uncharacterized Zn-finger protein